MAGATVRPYYPTYEASKDTDVQASYRISTPHAREEIRLSLVGDGYDGGSLAVYVDYDTAVRIVGAMTAAIHRWDEQTAERERIAAAEREEAEACRTVAESRS